MKFAWDQVKATANRQKHGVDFNEATTVFGDSLAGTFADSDQFHWGVAINYRWRIVRRKIVGSLPH